MARSVWALADEEVVEHMFETTEPNARSWLFNMMESLTSEHFIMVAVSLCAIWTARRKAIHEGEFQSPLSTHYFVKRFLQELSLIPKTSSGVSVTPGRERGRGWIPPGEGLIKANVDAAVSRDKSTGSVAVVLRRGDGLYMGSSAVVFKGVFDPPTLEALACREALALATDVAGRRLVIASDCKQVVLDIAERTGGQYAAIIQEINIQRLDFQEVSYTFEGRNSNKEAHSLARFALALDQGRHLWLLQPHDFMMIPVILNVDQ
jgi:ribonuclease HI